MIKQPDTIFIQGLPKSATASSIGSFFKQLGVIKKDKRTNEDKVWVYKDKSGQSKGEATVTFEDEDTANASIKWHNGKEFEPGCRSVMEISIAERKAPAGGGRGGGRGNQKFGARDYRNEGRSNAPAPGRGGPPRMGGAMGARYPDNGPRYPDSRDNSAW